MKKGDLEDFLNDFEMQSGPEFLSISRSLDYYAPHCKSFSLTCAYNDVSDYNPYGTRGISTEDYNSALNEVNERALRAAKYEYDRLSAAQKASLPDFEELYKSANREFEEYLSKNRRETDKRFGRAEFNYAKRSACGREHKEYLSNFYDVINDAGSCRNILERTARNTGDCGITDELESYDCYRILKENLKRTAVSFFWHCTRWGRLTKTFFFGLNEDTEYWVECLYYKVRDGFETLFGKNPPLEDFALYDGDGNCIFSRCDDVGFQRGIDRSELK